MRLTVLLAALLACVACASVASGQREAQQPSTMPAPTAGVTISITFADPAEPMQADEVLLLIAYLASDPEMRQRPDFQVTPVQHISPPGAYGSQAMVAPGAWLFVGNGGVTQAGLDVQLTTAGLAPPGADLAQFVAPAAQRVVEALSAGKPPPEQAAKRVRETDQEHANINDKKNLLHAITLNTGNLGPEILKDRIKAAELERQRLEMDLAAKRVRRDAIADQINRIQKEVEQLQAKDEVLEQLRRVVALRKTQWERAVQLQKTNDLSASEAAEAEQKWMDARIRVVEREETVRQNNKAGLLERLNDELASLMIDQAEMEVRLALIRDQQPSMDVRQMDEEKLTRLTDQYRALFRDRGVLPPLYFQLEKQALALRCEKLALLVSGVKVTQDVRAPGPQPANPESAF